MQHKEVCVSPQLQNKQIPMFTREVVVTVPGAGCGAWSRLGKASACELHLHSVLPFILWMGVLPPNSPPCPTC